MPIAVHRILSGGLGHHKCVCYQSRPNGPEIHAALCKRDDCPNPFPTLNRAPVRIFGMLCQHHAKEELNAKVSLSNAGATLISFDDPKYFGVRVIKQTAKHPSISNARIPWEYCSDPNDKERAEEVFNQLTKKKATHNKRYGITCYNAECQTKVAMEDLYCRPCAVDVKDVVFCHSDRMTTYMGHDGDGEVTYEWRLSRTTLPLEAYIRFGLSEEQRDEIVAKLIQSRKRRYARKNANNRLALEHTTALRAEAIRNSMDFVAVQNTFTAREALFFVGPGRIGTSIDFSDFQGQDYMSIFHLSLRLIEDFDLSISDNQIALSPSSALSEESRNSLMHGGHSSDFNYMTGNPCTLGPFLTRHWPFQMAAAMQPDGSVFADLFVLFQVDSDYHSFSQVRASRGSVFPQCANMVRSPKTVTPSMIIRCKFHGGNINLQDSETEFTVLYADGNMNNRLDLPLDHESFVVTGQGIFTKSHYKMMAKQGKVDAIDLLPDVDASQSYEDDDIADEGENTSTVEECLLSQRANVLSSMAQNRSSDIALISTLQETACDIGDTTSSHAMNLLCGPSSLFRSTVADLALHEIDAVSEQAKELLEAVVTQASKNLSHRDGSLARRIVEEEKAKIQSAIRKNDFAKNRAIEEEQLAQLQNEIEKRKRRREMILSTSSGEATAPSVSPSPPPPKRHKRLALQFTVKFQSNKGEHSFAAKLSSTDTSNIPDTFRQVLSDAVFDWRKKHTTPVDKFTRVISSQRSEVFHAKLYPNKHDENDCKLFIAKCNHFKVIPVWKVADKVWVYVVPPFVLSRLGITDSKRMRIAIVKQS
eukprot:scaffold5605_cov105-Skeletonema_dohrnii-CCMP3373.AAC.5